MMCMIQLVVISDVVAVMSDEVISDVATVMSDGMIVMSDMATVMCLKPATVSKSSANR